MDGRVVCADTGAIDVGSPASLLSSEVEEKSDTQKAEVKQWKKYHRTSRVSRRCC